MDPEPVERRRGMVDVEKDILALSVSIKDIGSAIEEHGQMLNEHGQALKRIDERLEHGERRFDVMGERIAAQEATCLNQREHAKDVAHEAARQAAQMVAQSARTDMRLDHLKENVDNINQSVQKIAEMLTFQNAAVKCFRSIFKSKARAGIFFALVAGAISSAWPAAKWTLEMFLKLLEG